MPAQQQHWIRTAYLSGATGPVSAGYALVSNGTRYVVATSANRTSYGRSQGVAISAGDDDDTAIEIQCAGVIPNDITDLGAGSVSWVRVSTTGTLERCTPASGDDLVGKCNARGDLQIQPGVWDHNNSAGAAFAAPTGTGPVTVTSGVLDADAGTTTGTGAYARQTSPTFLTNVSYGPTPATAGEVRLSNNWFVWARDFANGTNVSLLGLNASDVIVLGGGLGANMDIEIDAGATKALTLRAQELALKANAIQIGSSSSAVLDVGGGVGAVVGWNNATTIPSTNPTGGIIQYVDPADNTLKYRQADGTVVVLDGAIPSTTGTVNIMDYYDVADGGATFTLGGVTVTTKNIANAMQRAYEDKLVTNEACTLLIPPAADYGVVAYSWKEPLTWSIRANDDNVTSFEIVGSGKASVIVPDSTGGTVADDKLYFAGAGPDALSTIVVIDNIILMGDEAVGNDCRSFFRGSVDIDLRFSRFVAYSVQASAMDSGVVIMDAMRGRIDQSYFHGCTNGANGGVLLVSSCCFGLELNNAEFYPYERDFNPLGGTLYTKGALVARYHMAIVGGGDIRTATRMVARHCTFAETGVFAGVLADPSIVAGTNVIDVLHFDQCVVYGGTTGLIDAVSNVRHIILDGCAFDHNSGKTVDMQSSTCERLSIIRTKFNNSDCQIYANTGQASVLIEDSIGGTYVLDGVVQLETKRSTWDSLACATTPATNAKKPFTAITKSDATDLTLTATQFQKDRIVVSGTPGGAFNIIGPSGANVDGAVFRIANKTASALTIKKAAGTGIVIAATKTADVRYDHTAGDYVRESLDA